MTEEEFEPVCSVRCRGKYVCKSMSCDGGVTDDKAIACFSCANSVIRGPNVAKMRAVNEVYQVAGVGRGVGAGAFIDIYVGATDDVVDGPRGRGDD